MQLLAMCKLTNFPVAKQSAMNSCWACAGREISNWFRLQGQSGEVPYFSTDKLFAKYWAETSGVPEHADINVQQSAAAALGDIGYGNSIDDHAIPDPELIKKSLKMGMPLLAIVKDAPPSPNPNPNCRKGHWVVIVGISTNAKSLSVFDPNTGQVHDVAYDPSTYRDRLFWQNTSYVDPIDDVR